jgi:hypothetical protein
MGSVNLQLKHIWVALAAVRSLSFDAAANMTCA